MAGVDVPETVFEIYEIGVDYVLGLWKDDADVEHVRMYRLERS